MAAVLVPGAQPGWSCPGQDHIPGVRRSTATSRVEVERFLSASSASMPERADAVPLDRVLATVLFHSTSSGERRRRRRWCDRGWRGTAWSSTTASKFGRSSRAIAGWSSTPPGTDSSLASTGRRGRSAAPARFGTGRRPRPRIRAGLHTGECELLKGKVAGIAVSIGARVAAQADAGEVLVSGPSRISSLARASTSTSAGSASRRGFRGSGSWSRRRRPRNSASSLVAQPRS